MLPLPLRVARVVVWLQVALLTAGAAACLALAAILLPSLPGDDQGEFAGLGLGLFQLALSAAALCAAPAVLLAVAARQMREAGGRRAVGALLFLVAIEAAAAAVGLTGVVQALRRAGVDSAVGFGILTAPCVVVVVAALTPSARAWFSRSARRPSPAAPHGGRRTSSPARRARS